MSQVKIDRNGESMIIGLSARAWGYLFMVVTLCGCAAHLIIVYGSEQLASIALGAIIGLATSMSKDYFNPQLKKTNEPSPSAL